MSGSAAAYRDRLLEWLARAVAEGWIPEEEVPALEALETGGADSLFEPDSGRPLTVGLFGGTGVGKSSLLNRLVGETVAAVGLERPTSTEVTLYVHERYPPRRLEELCPIERVRVLEHRRDEYRDVVWIDMPDIDSVAHANRELVFQWLPCIDWLIYVVSPERYRDDAGWQVLARRGYRHHWLFVMNRRDTGTEEQYRDFRRLLAEEGYDESLVLATSCRTPEGDGFAAMVETIDRAVSEHGLARLQRVGERARLLDLERACARYSELLGSAERWKQFIGRGRQAVTERLGGLARYLEDEATLAVARIPDRVSADGGRVDPPSSPALLGDYLADLESAVVMGADGLPFAPLREGTRRALGALPERVAALLREGFTGGAARPGNVAQRALEGAMRKLVYALPLAAGAGIAYVVVTRYLQGLGGDGPFLGVDFLVHSLMLLALAALMPYLAARLLRPSVRRSVLRRVKAGLFRLQASASAEWAAAMEEVFEQSRERLRALETIRADIEAARNAGS
ncbi:MAG: GTPase [Arenicellales bacterium]